MTCPTCQFPYPPHELIGGLCHRCTAEELRILKCALVSMKCAFGEMAQENAVLKARATVE